MPKDRETRAATLGIASHQSRYCITCKYDLRGLSEGRCPECGRQFDLADRSTYASSRKTSGLTARFLCYAIPAVLVVSLWVSVQSRPWPGLPLGMTLQEVVVISVWSLNGPIAALLSPVDRFSFMVLCLSLTASWAAWSWLVMKSRVSTLALYWHLALGLVWHAVGMAIVAGQLT